MKTRTWSIRAKLVALVALPMAALLALWMFATILAVVPAGQLLDGRTLLNELGLPGENLVAELQRERRLSVVSLAAQADLSALREQRTRTDQAVTRFRDRARGRALRDAADDVLTARLDQLLTALEALPTGRNFIDRRALDRAGAVGLYSGMISSVFEAFHAMSTLPDDTLNRQAQAITELGRARELLGQADALLAGALTAGRYAPGEHAQLVQIIGVHRYVTGAAVAELGGEDRATYQRLTETEAFVRLRTYEDQLVQSPETAPPPVDGPSWQTKYDAVQQMLRDFELGQAELVAGRTVPVAAGILARFGIAGLLGLLAVVVSVLVALRVGRSLARRLTDLKAAAVDLSEQRLPDVVARLRRGEEVDVAREAPPLGYGDDEIGQLARAFSHVQRTAVRSAVDEATLRQGVNEVFLNIARRTQALAHRQLALLDRMEQKAQEPDELAALFQVDHLATRMRRHAEDLVILAGAVPGRGWRNPVPVTDVIRGAISEVEEYARVDLADVQPAAAVGRVVGDLIHLLAELVENATVFSPPDRRVRISGQRVPNGYLIEITDRGLGMSAEAVNEANERLSRVPEFNPADSARLGLFVVARLAARHDIRVGLLPVEGGGITAVVLVPGGLILDGPPAADGFPAVAGRQWARMSRLATLPKPPAGPAVESSVSRSGVEATTVPDNRAVSADSSTATPAPAEPALGPDGLPQRTRKRNLSSQPHTPAPQPSPTTGESTRPPQAVRAAMSALQTGTARGRQAAARTAPPGLPTVPVADREHPDPERNA